MITLEKIIEKLGFNPLNPEECPAPKIESYEDDTYISPYSILTLEESLFLFNLKHRA